MDPPSPRVAGRTAVAALVLVATLVAPGQALGGSADRSTDMLGGAGQVPPQASVIDTFVPASEAVLDVTGYFRAGADGATYSPLGPVRLLDTRTGNGLSGPFVSGSPRVVAIADRGDVPADAIAVTLNLTVTGQTAGGYVSLTTSPTANPSTSSLNFPRADTRANGLTVPLAADGSLAAVYMGPVGATAHLVLDVTGYFRAGADGATYSPLGPVRLLDTRTGNGLSGPFVSGSPRVVAIADRGDVPADAIAVTLNLTVTGQTAGGYVSLTTSPTANPSTSSLNFPRADTRANGLTVPLAADGSLAAVVRAWGSRPPDYPSYDSRYHNEMEMVARLHAAELAFPDLVKAFVIGRSHQGRPIWAAKVSDNVAVDEPEPEVLVDALHHAREHLTVEQALYLLQVLTADYATDARVRSLVDGREVFIVFALNPDGWAYDLTGSPYRGWRKNRQPTPGSSYIGTDPNRNYDYRWACCGGSSGNPAAWNYRGPRPFSAPETKALADFVKSRVVDGRQQIRTHVTLHTNGELILYPYGYTKTDVPSDMTADDHATFVAMARAMGRLNGYKAEQSSDLYVTDGDQIDWMYGRHRIFSFTFELYPPETVAKPNDHEPPDEVIAAQNARNRGALLYLVEMAGCPYAAIGRSGTYC